MKADIPDHVYAQFKRDPSVKDVEGATPHRALYVKRAQNAIPKGEIQTGALIMEGVNAFWEDKDVKVNFELQGSDFAFTFSRPIRGYFAISWSLNSDEIELLKDNQILSILVDDIVNISGKPIHYNLGSRMTYIKGKDERQIEIFPARIQDRLVGSAALSDRTASYSSAYRIWIDLILSDLRTKSVTFKSPMLALQEQFVL